jgi:mono/diheme cytochrome c family protein
MKRFWRWLKRLFFPPAGSPPVRRILPYVIVVFLGGLITLAATSTWEYTNTIEFCGTTCHTMPPEYVTHQLSPHARVTCEDCHLGRAPLGEQIVRKAQYSWQTGSATVLNNYELPIRAKNMRPARDVCETCHFPEQFSNDTLVELKHYADDQENTLRYTYLILKTGGGTKREGLGFGIHWHIENPVQFLATDPEKQDIPYIRVQNEDGTFTEYIDVESGFDPAAFDESQLKTMDCMDCHNRTAHGIETPSAALDSMLARGEISASIPEIKKKSLEVLTTSYYSQNQALAAIESLKDYYRIYQPEFYLQNPVLVENAVEALKGYYVESVFPDQKVYWATHPDNAQHRDSPGCFRCHDGKHLTTQGEAVRLECNLCHSVPVVSSSSEFVTNIEISRGVEPDSHKNSNWIAMHREFFDETCQSCHTTEDPGGTSNTSFCSNSGCHGASWEFAGFDAPALRVILSEELKKYVTPTPRATAPPTPAIPGEVNYAMVAGYFSKCTVCHGAGGQAGLDLRSYESVMAGGQDGAVVIPGDGANSPLVKVQSAAQPHFGQFSQPELDQIIAWINGGAK